MIFRQSASALDAVAAFDFRNALIHVFALAFNPSWSFCANSMKCPINNSRACQVRNNPRIPLQAQVRTQPVTADCLECQNGWFAETKNTSGKIDQSPTAFLREFVNAHMWGPPLCRRKVWRGCRCGDSIATWSRVPTFLTSDFIRGQNLIA
jgi:hypothetical protein